MAFAVGGAARAGQGVEEERHYSGGAHRRRPLWGLCPIRVPRVSVTVVSSPELLGAASAVLFILVRSGRTTPVLAPRCQFVLQRSSPPVKCRTESKRIAGSSTDRCVAGDRIPSRKNC